MANKKSNIKTKANGNSTCSKDSNKQMNGSSPKNTTQTGKGKDSKDATCKMVESTLVCGACEKMLMDPVILNCVHMICAACLTGYREPSASEIGCPSCSAKHDIKGAKPLQVIAVNELLKNLTLNSEVKDSERCCVRHRDEELPDESLKSVCRNVTWKLNYESPEFAKLVQQLDSDKMPYLSELVLKSDVFKWKNGYPIESEVCFSEGLRWAIVVTPCRDDGNTSFSKALTFNLGLTCKGWADKSCKKPLTKAKLNVWFTINNLNDCALTYNSGPRCCKFDNLADARKRTSNVVCNVIPTSKLRDVSQGWIEGGYVSIVCRFKVPKKMIKLNLAQMQQLGLSIGTTDAPKACAPVGTDGSEHRKESSSQE
ncbi:uncharacterized protein LOC142340638 [Convolutriloba macropyga]|uniref:uncharacterized protein LOC142340638 n=1 Tax=Convolutriloba macropyga TaxID=536237 RepID=UPI003F52109E